VEGKPRREHVAGRGCIALLEARDELEVIANAD
jgi:hypothetical protein